jgi:aryl-alcohol dehydrogenase-like predicted oxidoreductase
VLAGERGVSRAQVALAWVLAQPAVTAPIVGATKPQHLEDAIAAAELQLSDDELDVLEADYVPHAPSGF